MGRQMKKAPALPLFGDAYLADTRHLSLEEHGAYLQLLLIAWRTEGCALPNDDARIARMLGVTPKKWAKLKPSIMAFWELTDAGWQQKRLLKERRFVAKKSEQNAESANARWNAKSLENNGADDANAMRTQCGNDAPSPSPTITEAKASADIGVIDPEAVMWRHGRLYLQNQGVSAGQAGSMLGKWKRDYGAEAVIVALGKAQREGAIDPVSFISACLGATKRDAGYDPNVITV
jgi:uncharacterized protein YdaU (DUF1376 family)